MKKQLVLLLLLCSCFRLFGQNKTWMVVPQLVNTNTMAAGLLPSSLQSTNSYTQSDYNPGNENVHQFYIRDYKLYNKVGAYVQDLPQFYTEDYNGGSDYHYSIDHGTGELAIVPIPGQLDILCDL